MQQASVMAGIEGERPQNKEGGHPQRAFMGGERYERSEVHRGGTPMVDTRLRNGVLQDISHLYTWLGADGQKRWRTERQSIASFLADVRAGKERKDPRYEHIPEDHIPSHITHSTEIIYSSGKKPREGDHRWVHLHYITSSGQPVQSEISILDSPIADAGKGAEPKRDRSSEGEEQDVFTAGREKNGFQEDTWQRRSEEQGELAQARAVLQTIVNTREDTIDENTPIDRIAGLTTEQVRQAERTVAQQIKNEGGGFDIVTKRTPQGRLEMLFGDIHEEGKWEVALYLSEGDSDQVMVENRYALTQPLAGMEHNFGFWDHRPGGKQVNLGYLALHSKKDKQLDDIRTMWQGLCWMSANMLAWDNPNTIMPEELGSAPLRNRSDNNR